MDSDASESAEDGYEYSDECSTPGGAQPAITTGLTPAPPKRSYTRTDDLPTADSQASVASVASVASDDAVEIAITPSFYVNEGSKRRSATRRRRQESPAELPEPIPKPLLLPVARPAMETSRQVETLRQQVRRRMSGKSRIPLPR